MYWDICYLLFCQTCQINVSSMFKIETTKHHFSITNRMYLNVKKNQLNQKPVSLPLSTEENRSYVFIVGFFIFFWWIGSWSNALVTEWLNLEQNWDDDKRLLIQYCTSYTEKKEIFPLWIITKKQQVTMNQTWFCLFKNYNDFVKHTLCIS